MSRSLLVCLALPGLGLGLLAATPALDPAAGSQVGRVYEAFLSPDQEPAEEADLPRGVPKQFQSTAPSKTRAQRVADGHRGHGVVRFSQDLSRAWVDVKVEGLKVEDINMFHIHCGKPGVLGPILVDFAQITDLQKNFLDDGVFSVEVTNEAITNTSAAGHGVVGAFTAGCLTHSLTLEGGKPPKVSTVAGMATLAEEGDLYFNLHTVGQTYYGDIRGQLGPARPEVQAGSAAGAPDAHTPAPPPDAAHAH